MPPAEIYYKAAKAIQSADLIVIGPGDLYASIIPNLVVKGADKAIQASSAKIIYIVNLMTRYTQTPDMTAQDHVDILSKYIGKRPDVVILNTGPIPSDILQAYQKEHEYPVVDDLNKDPSRVIRGDFVSTKFSGQITADAVKRSLLRHDKDKLTRAIMKLI